MTIQQTEKCSKSVTFFDVCQQLRKRLWQRTATVNSQQPTLTIRCKLCGIAFLVLLLLLFIFCLDELFSLFICFFFLFLLMFNFNFLLYRYSCYEHRLHLSNTNRMSCVLFNEYLWFYRLKIFFFFSFFFSIKKI